MGGEGECEAWSGDLWFMAMPPDYRAKAAREFLVRAKVHEKVALNGIPLLRPEKWAVLSLSIQQSIRGLAREALIRSEDHQHSHHAHGGGRVAALASAPVPTSKPMRGVQPSPTNRTCIECA